MNEATRQDLGMVSLISKSRAKSHLKNPSNDGSKVYGLDSDGKRVELKDLNDVDKFKKFEIDADLNEELSPEDHLQIVRAMLVKAEKDGDDDLKRRALADMENIKKIYNLNERVVYDNETQLLKARIAADDFMRIYRSEFRRMFSNFGKEAEAEFKKVVKDKFSRLQEEIQKGASKEDQLKTSYDAYTKAEKDGDIRGQELALAAIDLIKGDTSFNSPSKELKSYDMSRHTHSKSLQSLPQKPKTIDLDKYINEEMGIIDTLKDKMYVDVGNTQTIIHPLSKPDVRRPDRSYIVVRNGNIEAVQTYNSGPIEKFVNKYRFSDWSNSQFDLGMENASGKTPLTQQSLDDAIKAIEDSRDLEAKRQRDYYQSRGPVSGVGNMDEMIKSIVKEKLTKSSSVEDHIDDFKDSDAKQFKGKSLDKIKQMALASFLSKQGKKKVAEGFKVGQKVTYLGHPAEITLVDKDVMDRVYYNVSYDKGNGKTKAIKPL